MRQQMHWMLVAMLSMIGFVGATSAIARPPTSDVKGKGSVSGVVMKDGKPLANVTVRLMHPRPRGEGNGPSDGSNPKPGGNTVGPDQKQGDKQGGKKGGGKGEKPVPVAETTTDDAGKFTMTDVPAGEYVVVANLKEEGVGRAKVTINDGQTANVSLTVEPRGNKPKGGKRNK